MKRAEEYRLIVSAPFGTVWIAKPSKVPHIMTDNRRKVPREEFLEAVLQYTMSQLKDDEDTMSITVDDKVIAEITIKDKSLFE